MFNPKYTITPFILSNIARISEIKAIVERSRVLPLNEAQLRRQAIVRMAHTSTSIEGNKLAEFQVAKALAGQNISADWKSIQEVRNYQAALKTLDGFLQDNKTLTPTNILFLHSILTQGILEPEKTGHFRRGEIYIVDDLGESKENIRYKGPDPKKVPYLINGLFLWLIEAKKNEIHPIIQSALFHSRFVNIHPFTDGNGRMARLLTQFILYQAGWDFRKIIVLEDYYNRNRSGYYDALKAASGLDFSDDCDYTPWIEYFTKGFLIEALKVEQSLVVIGFGGVTDGKSQIFLGKDEIKLMDFLSTTGQMTSSDVEDVLGIAKRTAQLKLKNLVSKGLLKVVGKGPSTKYLLYSTR